MREVSVKEAQVQSGEVHPHGLTVDESVLGQEPLLLRRHGELVAAIVPIAESVMAACLGLEVNEQPPHTAA